MKAKLLIEGKEIEVEISEEDYKRITEKKKTGYERVPEMNDFYYLAYRGNVEVSVDNCDKYDDDCYKAANYYSDKFIAENNARADLLMRQLRRFAAEHRENELNWYNTNNRKYYITYDFEDNKISANYKTFVKDFGAPYFDSLATAQAAIEEFHDELIWYFTEYQDSL